MFADKCYPWLISQDRHLTTGTRQIPRHSDGFKSRAGRYLMLRELTSLFKALILSICQQPLSFLAVQPTLIKHTFTVRKNKVTIFEREAVDFCFPILADEPYCLPQNLNHQHTAWQVPFPPTGTPLLLCMAFPLLS